MPNNTQHPSRLDRLRALVRRVLRGFASDAEHDIVEDESELSMADSELIKDIKKVVEEVVKPRFDQIDARFDQVDASLAEVLKRLPPAPPTTNAPTSSKP
jgi:hypothetical protein